MFVRNWMARPIVFARPGTNLHDAGALMDRRKVRRLPILDDGKLVGILTRSDIEATLGKARNPDAALRKAQKTKASAVMTASPVTIHPSETLETAAQIMLRKKVSGLPVASEEGVVGMITESDIFRALCTVLGFQQRGARVVLSLNQDEDLLTQLQKAVGKYSLQGIVSYFNPETKQLEAVVRVRGRRPAAAPS